MDVALFYEVMYFVANCGGAGEAHLKADTPNY